MIKAIIAGFIMLLDKLSPLFDLGLRLYVANVFWKSGLVKITSWSTTVSLFQYEYSVPFLPPEVAAVLAAAVELGIPVFLVLGLGTRIAAIVLFVFNIIAVISYPDLLPINVKDHYLWGALLLVTIFHGPGKLSLDYFISNRFQGKPLAKKPDSE